MYLFSIAGILLRIRYKLIPRQEIVKRGYLFFHCRDTTQYTLQTHTTSRNCKKSVLNFLCRDTTQYTLQTHTTSRNCKKRVLIFSLPGHYPVYVANWYHVIKLKKERMLVFSLQGYYPVYVTNSFHAKKL